MNPLLTIKADWADKEAAGAACGLDRCHNAGLQAVRRKYMRMLQECLLYMLSYESIVKKKICKENI